MVVVIGVVVGRQQLAEQVASAQTAGQVIHQRSVRHAGFANPAGIVVLDRVGGVVGHDLVQVERQTVSVQTQTPRPARAVDIGSGEAHTPHAQRRKLWRDLHQGEDESTIGNEPARR